MVLALTDLPPSETQPARIHLSGYQARDFEVVDYRMYELSGTRLSFRGPPCPAISSGDYFVAIGAAQTFGCLCERPYPALLADKLGLPALNLGYGGAGPEFFLRQPALDSYINRARFAVVQVMSARSQSNSLFDTDGLEYLIRKSDGKAIGALDAYAELIEGSPRLRSIRPKRLTARLARLFARPSLIRLVQETRQRWINSYREWMQRIEVPVILLWFSKRAPAYRERPFSAPSLFGEFPQLVNEGMVAAVRAMCNDYVECTTTRGSPQPLVSRFTGRPVTVDPSLDRPDLGGSVWSHNQYYPSPEMHEDAANALYRACEKLLHCR